MQRLKKDSWNTSTRSRNLSEVFFSRFQKVFKTAGGVHPFVSFVQLVDELKSRCQGCIAVWALFCTLLWHFTCVKQYGGLTGNGNLQAVSSYLKGNWWDNQQGSDCHGHYQYDPFNLFGMVIQQVAWPSQDTHHSPTNTLNLECLINLICMSLDYGRKLENPAKFHADM